MATTLKDPLLDTNPEYAHELTFTNREPSFAEPSIDHGLTHPTTWSKLSRRDRKWIIFGIVMGVVLLGAIVAITVVLTRGKSGPVHKYTCVPHKGGYVCVVDSVNGICKTNQCCKFSCQNDKCQFDCNGKFDSVGDCFTSCSQGTTDYGCISNICVPTIAVSPVFKGDPCCGEKCPGCTGTSSRLQKLSEGVVSNPGPYTNFGQYVGAGILGTDPGDIRLVVSGNSGSTTHMQVFTGNLDGSDRLNLTPVVAAISTPCLLTGRNLYVGNSGELVGLTTVSGTCLSSLYEGYNNGTLLTAPGLEPNSLIVGQPADSDYVFSIYVGKMNACNTGLGGNPTVSSGAVTVTTGMCAGSLNSGKTLFVMAGAASTNTLGFFTYTLASKTWTSVFNPFVGGIPKGVSGFGNIVACSNNGSVVLVAGDNHVTVFTLTNPTESDYTKWRWGLGGMVSVTGPSNLSVSYDGKVVAWTLKDQDYITATTMLDQPFSHTQKLDIGSSTHSLGVGGLFVVPVDGSTYIVLSSSSNATQTASNDEIYYWVVQTVD